MSGDLRELVVVGGGPAGTALLIAASRMGALEGLAARGLAVVEQGAALGGGLLGGYAINGDSTAETFLSVVAPEAGPALAALAGQPAARAIAARIGGAGGQAVPLAEVARFLEMVGGCLGRRVVGGGGAVLTGWRGLQTRQRGDGAWVTMIGDAAGHRRSLVSRNVLIATGGLQTDARVRAAMLDGRSVAERAGGRLVASGDVLAFGGGAAMAARLRGGVSPRVVVVGSSTSALAACRVVLESTQAAVTLLHRRALRLFYASAEAALADGYEDFGADDICPVSGFVYRLGGLRLEAGDLVRRALRVGGRVPDARLDLCRLGGADDAAAAGLVDGADLVVHALGYRPRGLLVLDAGGRRVALAADGGGRLVDEGCRVCGADGRPVGGLFGLGLAAGFVPSGRLGGEASFSGQANGLWLWQNDAGAAILGQLDRQAARAAA